LVLLRAEFFVRDTQFVNDERRKYIPAATREQWKTEVARRQRRPATRRPWSQRLKVVAEMPRAGVPILAGDQQTRGRPRCAGTMLNREA
jgi:hypothetical protein